ATMQMTAGKEILDACRIHTRETALARSTGADVSPMTWDSEVGAYVFAITSPEPVHFDSGEALEDDEEDEPADVNQEALTYVNVGDILRETAELLQDDDLGSPLVQQIGAWLDDPMTPYDPKRLPLREVEAVGRRVLAIAASVLERQLRAAAGRLSDA